MAEEKGFEPLLTESESVVLPLHHSSINIKLISNPLKFYLIIIRQELFFVKYFQKKSGIKIKSSIGGPI